MAETKKYLHNIDVVKNKVTNFILNPATTAQRIATGLVLNSTHQGYVIFDTDDNAQYFWDGTQWVGNTTTETDPIFSAWLLATPPLYSYTETDPVWLADKPSYLTSAAAALAYEPIITSGTTGQYWSGDKTWQNFPSIPTVSPSALTKVDDTNVTLTLGGSPSTALLAATSLTLGWTGTLADSRIASASTWNAKEPGITAGTTGQYWRGDKTWQTFPTIPTVGTWGALNYPTWTSGTPFVKMTAAGTFALDTNAYLTGITSSDVTTALGYTPVTNARTLTINGTAYDLTADRSWTISTSGGILHGTASGTDTYTVTIAGATAYADGDAYLIRFPNGNTTSATINISGLGAVGLYRNNDGPLIGGDIWNGAEMLCVYNSTTGGFQLIGTSPNAMYAYITNADSVTITKGQVVYAFGGQGDRMTVKRALNTGDATSAQTVGVVLSTSIAANQKGVIITQGLLDGLSILPTSTYNDGDPLYLGATAGSITNVKPYAPNHLVYLGNVTTASNGAAGRWYVRVQNGYELDELHNVQAQTPTLNDTLWYDNAVSPAQWKTASIPTILGYTPVNPTRSISTTAPLSGGGDLSANRTLSISQATASTDGFLSSANWTTMMTQILLTGYQALGSTQKGITLSVPDNRIQNASAALADGSIRLVPVYIPVATTVTGVRWYQGTLGNYTADNYNGVGLYSHSAGVITLVASSTNDGNMWKNAGTANSWQSKAFTTPYSAAAGIYYIAALYNSSAEVTAPTLGAGSANPSNGVVTYDFTNGNKLVAGTPGATLITPITMTSTGVTNLMYGLLLY